MAARGRFAVPEGRLALSPEASPASERTRTVPNSRWATSCRCTPPAADTKQCWAVQKFCPAHYPAPAHYDHRVPIADISSIRSGDSVAARLRWFPIHALSRSSRTFWSSLSPFSSSPTTPFDVFPRYPKVPLALVELLGGLGSSAPTCRPVCGAGGFSSSAAGVIPRTCSQHPLQRDRQVVPTEPDRAHRPRSVPWRRTSPASVGTASPASRCIRARWKHRCHVTGQLGHQGVSSSSNCSGSRSS